MSRQVRIGYVPYSESYSAPGDYRRFVAYAKAHGLSFENARWDRKYDLVVLSERADISIWSRYPHGKIIYDFIDSYLAIPRTNLRQWLRGPAKFLSGQARRLQLDYWHALQDMCRRADAVICTTDEQRGQISTFCPNVHIVLDIHTSVVSEAKRDYSVSTPLRLVWEGLPGNIVQLGILRDVLHQLGERRPVELHLVTDLYGPRFLMNIGRRDSRRLAVRLFPPTVIEPWDRNTFSHAICRCDIAIIPIDMRDALVAGKPENKLLLLWRMGMPVITSATPAYCRAMQRSGVGLACHDETQWLEAIERLSEDEEARRRAGEAGKAYVEEAFSEAAILHRWDAVFQSLGYDFARRADAA